MPIVAYSITEVEAAVRLAYATGVRDTIIQLQGTPLTDEQVTMLRPLAVDPGRLRKTVTEITKAALGRLTSHR